MSDQVGSEGQDVKLTANLCAPFDKIQWHKRGGFLLDEKSMFTKYSTDRDSNTATLKIKNACAEDIAEYACVAKNTRNKIHLELNTKDTPALTKLPDVMAANMGKNVKLTCKLNNPNDTIQWFKRGKFLLDEKSKFTKYSVERDVATVALVIKNVCVEDIAEYACITKNVQGKTHLELAANQTPALAQLPEVMVASKGQDVKLKCILGNASDKVQWYKRGKFLLDEKSKYTKYTVERDGTTVCLVIKNVCAEDIAEYACVALNVQNNTKLEAGKEGQDVKLSCKLNGPVEKIQWHKRGGFLVDEKLRYTKYTVDRDGSTATLLIKNVCDEDIAEYSCVAKNVRGKIHLEFPAKDTMLAKLPEVKAVSYGQDTKLMCKLSGPVEKVEWYKRGKFLVDEKSKFTKYSLDRDNSNATLLIRNMCDEDIAEYTCIARNVCSRTHLELNANETPVLAKLPEVMVASKGKDVMLTSKLSKDLLDQCDKVQWHKNGKFLLDENSKYTKYDIKREGSTVTLVIRNMCIEDVAQYSCVALNFLNKTHLNITTKNGTKLATVASEGQDCKLTCQLTAPFDKIQWHKGGKFLVDEKSKFTKYDVERDSKNASLVMKNVCSADMAKYTCVAKNIRSKTHLELTAKETAAMAQVPEVMMVSKGQDAKLTCKLNNPDDKVQWYKNRRFLLDEKSKYTKYKVERAGSTATLVISNICAEDIAEYACVTLNIQTTTKLEPGKEGQDVKLTCKLSGPVEKVQWHKRGGFLVDEKLRYTKYSVDRDSTNATLLIRNVCGEDLADYACVAKNIRCKTHLEMKDSQVLSKLPEVFISPAGKDVHLTSTLKKDHLDQNDSIQWHKNGKFLVDEKSKYSKYNIKRDGNMVTLVIRNMCLEDVAEYSCVAENAIYKTRFEVTTGKGSKRVEREPSKKLKVTAQRSQGGSSSAGSKITGSMGHDTLLTCSLTAPVEKVQWNKRGFFLLDEKSRFTKYVVDRNSRSASLLIQNVCDEDIAEYACVGQNTRAKTHLELSAKETPALEKLPEVKVASMGKSVKLNCKLANLNDKVQWNKNRKYLLNESERAKYTKYSLDRDGANVALVIGNVCNEDVGEYACVTENVQDKIHIELKASETPALAKLPEVMAASRGKDVKLSCKLNNPNDKVQWQKRGKFLLDEKSKFSKYSVDRDNTTATLLIKNVCDEDVAEYACVTKNVQNKLHLELMAKETPALAQLPEVMVASKGQDVKLTCKLGDASDKVQWYKGGKFLLDENSKYTKYSVERDGGSVTLVIKNVCQEDVAEYACVALNVQTKTKLEAGKEGQDVKLSCKLNGPVEKVQWHKRGGFLVDEKLRYTKYTVDRDGNTATLMIKNVCDEDVAEYSCVAKNVRGKTHLELNAKESLLAKLPEVKAVSKGQNVKLTCYLNGPVDKVQWYKRGKFLVDEKSKYTKYSIDRDGSTATLLIKNMCSEDIAEYSCVAKNVRNKTHLELNAKESMLSKLPEVKAVSKGQDVKLTCRLNGAVDKVQWHKRGRFLVDEKSKYTKYSVDRDGMNATLLIRNICAEDVAEYACVAKNIRSKVHLELNTKENPVLSSVPEVMAVSKGQDVKVTSKLSSSHLDRNDRIQWHKNKKFLLDERSKYTKYSVSRDGTDVTLLIRNMCKEDVAEYSCVALNVLKTFPGSEVSSGGNSTATASRTPSSRSSQGQRSTSRASASKAGGPKKSAKASSGRAATPQRHERSPTPEYESKTYDFDPNMKSTMVRAKGAPDIDGSSNTIFILDLMRQQREKLMRKKKDEMINEMALKMKRQKEEQKKSGTAKYSYSYGGFLGVEKLTSQKAGPVQPGTSPKPSPRTQRKVVIDEVAAVPSDAKSRAVFESGP